MSDPSETVVDFRTLFRGLDSAYGTGRGAWVRKPHNISHFVEHLAGRGPGLGIGPLMPDNNVWFAAIDLDEPNFALAKEMQEFIPGRSWIERTRSGNVHVWVFFAEPLEAWVAMGLLKDVCVAVGRKHTEVFPKNHNFAKVDLGNYINLPYHGQSRPIFYPDAVAENDAAETWREMPVSMWVKAALRDRIDPELWRRRAALMMISDPAERDARSQAKFGKQQSLHMCAEHVIANCEDNPLVYGHQSNTMFMLAKCLTNWEMCDHDEALGYMRQVNEAAQPGLPDAEILRILRNAEEKQYTSTGCDDPVVAPYVHPDCPIAHGG